MPLLKIVASKKITAIVTIEDATAKQINQYAAMTKGSADDVVQAALDYVFSSDKEFTRFRDENASAKPRSRFASRSLRARGRSRKKHRPAPSPARPQHGNALATTRIPAGVEAVLRTGIQETLHPFQGGAAEHGRVPIGTP